MKLKINNEEDGEIVFLSLKEEDGKICLMGNGFYLLTINKKGIKLHSGLGNLGFETDHDGHINII